MLRIAALCRIPSIIFTLYLILIIQPLQTLLANLAFPLSLLFAGSRTSLGTLFVVMGVFSQSVCVESEFVRVRVCRHARYTSTCLCLLGRFLCLYVFPPVYV